MFLVKKIKLLVAFSNIFFSSSSGGFGINKVRQAFRCEIMITVPVDALNPSFLISGPWRGSHSARACVGELEDCAGVQPATAQSLTGRPTMYIPAAQMGEYDSWRAPPQPGHSSKQPGASLERQASSKRFSAMERTSSRGRMETNGGGSLARWEILSHLSMSRR